MYVRYAIIHLDIISLHVCVFIHMNMYDVYVSVSGNLVMVEGAIKSTIILDIPLQTNQYDMP